MVEELKKLYGVTTASFNERTRYFIVYYDQNKVNVPTFVQNLSKITSAPEEFTLSEAIQ